jgi:hypothetical protein
LAVDIGTSKWITAIPATTANARLHEWKEIEMPKALKPMKNRTKLWVDPFMKPSTRAPLNYLIILFLTGTSIGHFGCASSKPKPDPLAGWKIILSQAPNEMISRDYQDYIQHLPLDERNYGGPVFYFGNGTGMHAVTFEMDKYGKDVWNYYIFYDKYNKRTKVLKYNRGRYWNP